MCVRVYIYIYIYNLYVHVYTISFYKTIKLIVSIRSNKSYITSDVASIIIALSIQNYLSKMDKSKIAASICSDLGTYLSLLIKYL